MVYSLMLRMPYGTTPSRTEPKQSQAGYMNQSNCCSCCIYIVEVGESFNCEMAGIYTGSCPVILVKK